MKRLVLALFFVAFGLAAQAQPVTTPERGSSLRADILAALRPSIEKETGGRVQFVITVMHVMGGWAYVDAKPQRPDGGPINWRATRHREAYDADAFSGLVLALLRRQDGRWTVVDTFIGPTDVAWYEWVKKYKLPEAFFQGP
jgi:hypothetical protein